MISANLNTEMEFNSATNIFDKLFDSFLEGDYSQLSLDLSTPPATLELSRTRGSSGEPNNNDDRRSHTSAIDISAHHQSSYCDDAAGDETRRTEHAALRNTASLISHDGVILHPERRLRTSAAGNVLTSTEIYGVDVVHASDSFSTLPLFVASKAGSREVVDEPTAATQNIIRQIIEASGGGDIFMATPVMNSVDYVEVSTNYSNSSQIIILLPLEGETCSHDIFTSDAGTGQTSVVPKDSLAHLHIETTTSALDATEGDQFFWSSDENPSVAAVEPLSGDTTTITAASGALSTSYIRDDVDQDEYTSLGFASFLNDVGDGGIVVNGEVEEDNCSRSTISPSPKKLSTISSEELSMTTARRDQVKSKAKQQRRPMRSTKNVELERLSSSLEDSSSLPASKTGRAAAEKRAYSCETSSPSDADETSMTEASTARSCGRRKMVNITVL